MFATLTLLAATLTQLGELAAVIASGSSERHDDFCVTGTVAYVVSYHENLRHVVVEDGGVGVDCSAAGERAKAFNGTVGIVSSPGSGTEISVVLEERAGYDFGEDDRQGDTSRK